MIELPFPAKVLWPNGRTRNHKFRAAEVKKHRAWAHNATLAERSKLPSDFSRITWIVHPKPKGPAPDKDNIVAALKSYQDGISAALGLNDRTLAEPSIIIGERVPEGRVVAVLAGEAA